MNAVASLLPSLLAITYIIIIEINVYNENPAYIPIT